jgi:hypothetical protein
VSGKNKVIRDLDPHHLTANEGESFNIFYSVDLH